MEKIRGSEALGFTEEKLQVIGDYLKAEFPGLELDDEYQKDRISQTFRLDDGKRIFLITFQTSFFQDHTARTISTFLKHNEIKEIYQDPEAFRVVISNKGIVAVEKA